jgi:hypothetical protein
MLLKPSGTSWSRISKRQMTSKVQRSLIVGLRMYLDYYIKSISNMCFLSTPRILKSVFEIVKYCKDFVILCGKYEIVYIELNRTTFWIAILELFMNLKRTTKKRLGCSPVKSRLPPKIQRPPIISTNYYCGSTIMVFMSYMGLIPSPTNDHLSCYFH